MSLSGRAPFSSRLEGWENAMFWMYVINLIVRERLLMLYAFEF